MSVNEFKKILRYYFYRQFSEFFVAVSFGKTLQNPGLVAMKPKKYMNMIVSKHRYINEIMLKLALKIIQSSNYSTYVCSLVMSAVVEESLEY